MILTASVAAVSAQTPNTWNLIGPTGSRDIRAFAVDPGNPSLLYLASVDGFFKSTDAGASWIHRPLPNQTRAIAIDPHNSNNIYAGTSPDGPCNGSYPFYRSVDGGATWSNAGSPNLCDVSLIYVDPEVPGWIYIESTFPWFGNGDPVWIRKSTDGGLTWNVWGPGVFAPGLTITHNPHNPRSIFAPGDTEYGGVYTNIELFKSIDDGASWTAASQNDTNLNVYAVDPVSTEVIYTNTSDTPPGRILKSVDGGQNWFTIGDGLDPNSHYSNPVIDPSSHNTVYLLGGGGVAKSSDAGAHWTPLNNGLPEQPYRAVIVAPDNSHTLYAVTHQGVFKLIDNAPPSPNPILQTDEAGVAFFVRQHYLDFLGREPEAGEPWSAILLGCSIQFNTDPNSASTPCDRITVSGAFFGSPEFKAKGIYVIDFYRVAFNRLPAYSEFSPDLHAVTGATAQEASARRADFANAFVSQPEFAALAGKSNSDYVNTLMAGSLGQDYNLASIHTADPMNPDGINRITLTTSDLINSLNSGTLTRAQVLRAIVQSDEITLHREAVNAFVAVQYYGYLRRTPEPAGFNAWANYLQNHPTDFRTMINGFVNSIEYRSRFGTP